MKLWKRKRSAGCLDCFQAVLEAHEVLLEMTAHVLWIAEGGTFEVHHIFLDGNHMLATMAHNSDILGSHQSLVVSLVSCWMQPGVGTGVCLEMVAAKADNYTLVVGVEEIDSRVARIECLCLVDFHHYHLMLPHCHLGAVVSQTANWLEPYWLSLAQIHLSTSYMKKRLW